MCTRVFPSHIATMLKSHDCHMIVGGVQMAHILMEKLPDIFLIYFYREGVVHEVKLLRDGPFKLLATPQKEDKTPPLLHPTPCQLPPTTSSATVQTTPPGPSHTHTSTRRHVAHFLYVIYILVHLAYMYMYIKPGGVPDA